MGSPLLLSGTSTLRRNTCLILLSLSIAVAKCIQSFSKGTDARSDTLACFEDLLYQSRFSGRIDPNRADQAFRNVTDIDNQRCAVTPLVIVWPKSSIDVAAVIRAAESCQMHFSVISGGHGAAGYALAKDGVTISMEDMSSVAIDSVNGILEIGPGARFKNIYAALNASGGQWVAVGGGCPMVAPGGFYLGGGWSFLSRSYGLGVDTLLSVTTVLADGRVVVASGDTSCARDTLCNNLWWASRGGGGGNFGVVTKFRVKLAPAVLPGITIGQLCWDADVPALGDIWQWLLDAYPAMPDWLQIDPGWLPLGSNGTRLFCHTVICNHADAETCNNAVAPVATRPDVTLNTLSYQPYLTWQMAHNRITAAQHGYLYLTNFVMEAGVVSAAVMQRLQQAVLSSPSPRNLVIFHLGGGKIASVNATATAFPHRSAQLVLQIKAIWDTNTPSVADANMQWVAALKSWLTPLSSGSYVNYIDPFLDNWESMYYGNNLARLWQVKHQVDPTNAFVFNQSIRGSG
eukprot:m.1503624 g.1503624  ORF g.1503624 m.1503624 type:complete len:516 (-) comp25208_c0_seq2:4015-5562(-)